MLDYRLQRHLLLVVYDERTALEPLELRTRETLICRYNHIYPCHLLELAYLPLKVVRGPEADDLKVDLRAILLEAKVRYEDVGAGDEGLGLPLQRPSRAVREEGPGKPDRKSTRLNSSHANISYAVFC